MIKEDEIIEIGKFHKTHALKGELNALFDIEPDYIEEENPLIVNIDGIYVPFYAESVRTKGSKSYLIKLRGVDDIDEASRFVNQAIYGKRADLIDFFEAPDETMFFQSDLLGYTVRDKEYGNLGVVKRVDDTTINTLLIIDEGPYGELYIPFNENLIDEIDDENESIIMVLPDGLVEINEKKTK